MECRGPPGSQWRLCFNSEAEEFCRGDRYGPCIQGQCTEALCGQRRSQHSPGNSIEVEMPGPWSRREEMSV